VCLYLIITFSAIARCLGQAWLNETTELDSVELYIKSAGQMTKNQAEPQAFYTELFLWRMEPWRPTEWTPLQAIACCYCRWKRPGGQLICEKDNAVPFILIRLKRAQGE
jgi:hypothetical protein